MTDLDKRSKTIKNALGDAAFMVQESREKKVALISFEYNCDQEKRIFAQQIFLQLPVVLHQERGKPLLVKNYKAAKDWAITLKKICEYWQINLSEKPLWNWTEKNITSFFQHCMLRSELSAQYTSPVYSFQRYNDYAQAFNTSHNARLTGKSNDGLSFPITSRLKQLIMEPILDDLDLTFAEWKRGQSYPPVPLNIAAVLLSKAIEVLESKETAVALSLYTAWRKNPGHHEQWFTKKGRLLDIVELIKHDEVDHFGLKTELQLRNVEHIAKLPWKGKEEFRKFRRRLIGACINIIFIQSAHRCHEFRSTVSNDRRKKHGLLQIKQRMDKSMDGLKVYRPLAELSTRAAETLWNLSFVDPDAHPIPLQHTLHNTGYAEMVISNRIPDKAFSAIENVSLNKRINAFYQTDVLSIMPEANRIHPALSTHQFRHSFAEFALRRFDEDVHESLREHFVHSSEYSTRIYEQWKLSPAVQSMLEKDYLYELIGKTSEGTLDERFWGPAYKRLKNEIDQIKFFHPDQADEYFSKIIDKIERFAVFEWGFCVLFCSSKREAKCHDPLTGLPDVDGRASPSICTNCPNNMGNTIQKNNLTRVILAHSDIAKSHPIKAIGKLSLDIVEQISRRIYI